VLHAVGLPWDTRLVLHSPVTWDVTLSWGLNVLCSFGVQIECKGSVESKFEGNGANGAKFSFKGSESGKLSCSDGGEGTIESNGPSETLGATVS
jgi:hypothetical protein